MWYSSITEIGTRNCTHQHVSCSTFYWICKRIRFIRKIDLLKNAVTILRAKNKPSSAMNRNLKNWIRLMMHLVINLPKEISGEIYFCFATHFPAFCFPLSVHSLNRIFSLPLINIIYNCIHIIHICIMHIRNTIIICWNNIGGF